MKTFKLLIIIIALIPAGCVEVNNNEQKKQHFAETASSPYYAERKQMVKEQIISRGIYEKEIIDAFLKFERHLVVPGEYRSRSYGDHPLPIGEGQTISQPYIVAFMTQVLDLKRTDRVLEVGTGSGYQAAILGELSDHVYTIEINKTLGRRAEKLLKDLGYDNVRVRVGDGYKGWEEHAPFDAIIVTAAPTHVPAPLKEQLKEGGRMIIPVGDEYAQELVYIRKVNNELERQGELPVRFVPLVDPEGKTY
jgi:protein-L-isoaspartate(D-aspartate) O-methyltransferase